MGEQTGSLKNEIQYLSKWRGTWEYFRDSFGNIYEPNKEEIKEMKRFNYQLRICNDNQ